MTLTFKLVWGIFLLLFAAQAFKLHEGGEGIDEGAITGEGLGLDSNPFGLEMGMADKPAEQSVLGSGRILAAKRRHQSKKSRTHKKKKVSIKKSLKTGKKHLNAVVVKLAKKKHSKSLKSKLNKKLQHSKPAARKLVDKMPTKKSKKSQKVSKKQAVKPAPRKLSDHGSYKHAEINDNAGFMQMMHDRQRRLAALHIKTVPPTKKKIAIRTLSKNKQKSGDLKKKSSKKISKISKKNEKLSPKPTTSKKSAKTSPGAVQQQAQQLTAPPQIAAQSVVVPAPVQVAPIIQTPMAVQPTLYVSERTLEDEERKAQNFVTDLQNQVRQTRLAVDSIQDKLIVIKENENEIKSMLTRIMQNRNMVV